MLAAQVCVRITFWWIFSKVFVAEFLDDFRITIPVIAEYLKDSGLYVHEAVIELLSRLGEQGMC